MLLNCLPVLSCGPLGVLHLVGINGAVGAVAEALGDVVAELGVAVAGVHGLTGGNCIKIGLPGKSILSKRNGLLEVLFS